MDTALSRALAKGNQLAGAVSEVASPISNWTQQWTQSQPEDAEAEQKLLDSMKAVSADMLKETNDAIHDVEDFIKNINASLRERAEMDGDSTLKLKEKKEFKMVLREDCIPLNHLCQCLERVLLFGYKKNLYRPKKKLFRSSSCWSFLSDAISQCKTQCEQLATDFHLIQSIESLNDNGKMRAFLRQSLRSRLIPLYFKLILEQSEIIQFSAPRNV